MVLKYLILLAFLLLGCSADWERDHPYDPKAANYVGAGGGSSSSASLPPSSNSMPSSSSISSSSSAASSSSSRVSSSSVALSSATQSSSSSIRSSSSATPSSSSAGTQAANCPQIYATVSIGTQVWMAENLNCDVSGSKCYGDDPANCIKYGRLYDWATAMNLPSSCNSSNCASQVSSKHRGLCPSGWHIPSDEEWTTLENNVGGSSTAGTKLKATSGWNGSGNGTDIYGFAALPGGIGYSGGGFNSAGNYGYWRSSSEFSADYAYRRSMDNNLEAFYRSYSLKTHLLSVRCLQN